MSAPGSIGQPRALAAIAASHGAPDSDLLVERALEPVARSASSIRTIRCGPTVLGISDTTGNGDLAAADGWAAVTTGTWDNADELSTSLGSQRDRPAGLLLEACQKWGPRSLPGLLRGTFAAVVTDGSQLWCFRDHLGFETLFHTEGPGPLVVASEAKQLLNACPIPREPNMDFIEGMFYGDLDDETLCAYRGIRRLPKRSLLQDDGGTRNVVRYWQPEDALETGPDSLDEISDRFHHLMGQAVARSLTGHDLVSLSGGIDSPSVAAYAAPLHREMGESLAAYTHVYPEHPSVDELRYVEMVTERLGIPLNTYVRQPPRLDQLALWVEQFDGPWPGWDPSGAEEQLEVARRLGFTNVLTGELAEFVVDQPDHLVPHLLSHGELGAALAHLRWQRSMGTPLPAIWRQIGGTVTPRSVRRAYWRRHPGLSLPRWVTSRRTIDNRIRRLPRASSHWSDRQVGFLHGAGLSMEAAFLLQSRLGVRMRTPWADIDLWEFFLSLPAAVKYPPGPRKALIRTLMRGRVPDEILDRRDKTVFNDFVLQNVDYSSLRKWVNDSQYRLPGVDYQALAEDLDREALDLRGYMWAKDLAVIHAFLAGWS